jgi:predicted outer membrane repeat protein
VIAADGAGGSSTIDVPAGLYKLTIAATSADDPSNGDLDINNGASVTIVGAGSDSTTLSGNNVDRLFSVQSGASLTLSKMTVRQGQPSSSSSGAQDGGAIYTDGGLTTTGDVVFQDNTAPSGEYGGAIYADADSTVSLTGATFENNGARYGGAINDSSNHPMSISKSSFSSDNTGDYDGGAIASSFDTSTGGLDVSDSTFTANNAADGGAIYWDVSSTVSVTHSTFNGNSNDYGGAIDDQRSSSMTLDYDSFIDNSAYDGGALVADGTAYTLDHDLFKGNTGTDDVGGAVYWESGSLSSSDSTYVDNNSYYGGAIYDSGSGDSLTLINDTLSHNGGANNEGGALYVDDITPASLINDTITKNSAKLDYGGGIAYNEYLTTAGYTGSGTAGVKNTVIADNNGGDCYTQFTSPFDLGHNMDSDGSCFSTSTQSSDKPNTEPNLGNPADNGGPLVGNTTDGSAVRILTDAETAASPTVNAGTNTNCPSTDERGVTRPQGGVCDIGAFELGSATLKVKKSGPSSVRIHKKFTYTIKVTDSGTDYSNSTTLVDKIPSSETLKHVTAPKGATCSHSGRTVTCKLGRLASKSSATVKIEVSANKVGKVKNTAKATNAEGSKAFGHVTTKVKAAAVKAKKKKKTSPIFTG